MNKETFLLVIIAIDKRKFNYLENPLFIHDADIGKISLSNTG